MALTSAPANRHVDAGPSTKRPGRLQYIGQVDERHDGRFEVTIGDETEIFDKPKHKNIDEQQVVDLRRMLRAADFAVDERHEN